MKLIPLWFAGFFLAAATLVGAGCKSDAEQKCKAVIEKAFKDVPRELADKVKDKMAKQLEACKKLAPDEIDCFDRDFRKANKEKCDAAKKKMKDAMGGE
ncbi:MAG: hypothetical protein HYY84_01840 [Deltaproteobacteria bacterium]|nr:hypothetical protein [Deltaproteobacteria bacterium]